MDPVPTSTRASVVAAVACVGAAFFAAELPFVALPACAAALATLSYGGHPVAASFVAGVSAAVAAFAWGPEGALAAAIGLLCVLGTIAYLRHGNPWRALGVLTAILATTFVGSDALVARLNGETLVGRMQVLAEADTEAVTSMASLAGADVQGVDIEALQGTLFATWPASYAVTAIVTAIAVLLAIGWAARRRGVDTAQLPPLALTDLSPHVLWLPIGGVMLLAVARVADDASYALTALGSNALLVVRPLLAWQGLGVVAERLDRVQAHPAVRVLVYAAALILEVLLLAMSLLGLVDFWANFRKLKRSDQEPTNELEGPASSL